MGTFRILSVGLLIIIGTGCSTILQSPPENRGTQADGGNSSGSQSATENEETRVVTEMVTVPETVPSGVTGEAEETAAAQGDSPEDALTLQFEYINEGDFEGAYSLFAQQSRQGVSLEQYRAFFEANAPYSITDYSFSSARVQGNSASVDVAFTVTSASGVGRLERTQEFVRENGDWRVVMHPEQVAIFSAPEDKVDSEPKQTLDPLASTTRNEDPPAEPVFDPPQLPLPPNGEVRRFTQAAAVAPFEIKASAGSNYLVKLVDANSGVDVLDVFVRSGSTIEIGVPLGSYIVKYAAGTNWYGYEYYFGPETVYSKADEIFYFEDESYQFQDGAYIYYQYDYAGYTMTLYPVMGGNLNTIDILPSEF